VDFQSINERLRFEGIRQGAKEMLEKEWITNDRGQIVAIWVEHHRVSPQKCDLTGVTTTDAPQSQAIPANPFVNDNRIHAAFRELQTLRASARELAPFGSSKSGNWSRFYSILKSVLP
jgi:hypothetical protein